MLRRAVLLFRMIEAGIRFGAAALLLAASTIPCRADGESGPLADVMKDLESPDFEERDEAERRAVEYLRALKAPNDSNELKRAMDVFRKAAGSDELETAQRAKRILEPFMAGGECWGHEIALQNIGLFKPLGKGLLVGRVREMLFYRDIADMEPAWRTEIPSVPFLIEATSRGICVAGVSALSEGWLACLDPENGKLLWEAQGVQAAPRVMALSGGRLYLGCVRFRKADTLQALATDLWLDVRDAGNGKIVKEGTFTGLPGTPQAGFVAPEGIFIAGRMGTFGDMLEDLARPARERGWLARYDADTWKPIWSSEDLPGSATFALDHTAGVLVGGAGWLALCDKKDGKLAWKATDLPAGAPLVVVPCSKGIVMGGGVFNGEMKGWLALYDLATGTRRWLQETPYPVEFADAGPEEVAIAGEPQQSATGEVEPAMMACHRLDDGREVWRHAFSVDVPPLPIIALVQCRPEGIFVACHTGGWGILTTEITDPGEMRPRSRVSEPKGMRFWKGLFRIRDADQ